jgi:hypothetical protein
MTTFGLITEGITDQIVIENILIVTDFGDTRNNGVFPSKKGQTHRFAPQIRYNQVFL